MLIAGREDEKSYCSEEMYMKKIPGGSYQKLCGKLRKERKKVRKKEIEQLKKERKKEGKWINRKKESKKEIEQLKKERKNEGK